MGKHKIFLRPTSMFRKQSGQFQKLFTLWENNNKNNHQRYKQKSTPAPVIKEGRPDFLNVNKGLSNTFVTRRQIVLNRHFTEIISDVFAVNLKKELSDLGVNITSIETKAWNKGIRIYYTTSKTFDIDLHTKLNSLITKLRAAVTERRLIGRTPQINFVFDEVAELNRNLDAALKIKSIPAVEEVKSLSNVPSDKIQKSKARSISQESTLNAKHFSAPDDMSNMMLGIDYPKLYNEVTSRLVHGRGESSRMISNAALISPTPLFRAPIEDEQVEDSKTRVLNMQKFLVNQRKKNDYMSKLRRKEELLRRDQYKWDLPVSKHDETNEVVDKTNETEDIDYNLDCDNNNNDSNKHY